MPTIFHPNINELSIEHILYALSDSTRLKIVTKLYKNGETPCQQFENLGKKNNLSHHYKILRENGIIYVKSIGRQRFLSLRSKELNQKFPNLISIIIEDYLKIINSD